VWYSPSIARRAALAPWLATLPPEARCLFPSTKGGEPTERALGYLVARYAALAQVKDVSRHDLRHHFGYRMAKTVPLHRLAQIMGHDSLDTTLIYVGGRSRIPSERSKRLPGPDRHEPRAC